MWCLLDTRPGHCNQVLGLTDALQRRISVKSAALSVTGLMHGLRTGFSARKHLPPGSPQLIIGAGHSTHFPLLQLGRRFSAHMVVLMKPTLPLGLFDLCLVPDVYRFRRIPANALMTTGVLNRVQPSKCLDPNRGLILVGGPSRHHHWSDETVMRQLTEVIRRSPSADWQIATSRRTPSSFIHQCRTLANTVKTVTSDAVGADWLPAQLRASGTVWVTEDSVSMLYEAVTSGAATGILELPRTRDNRATQCVDLLLNAGDATGWSEWKRTAVFRTSSRQLAEADRCAAEILNRGFLGSATGSHRKAA